MAEALAATFPPLFDEAVFHCRQAAEKALKGFLAWNGRTFRKAHNLEKIGEQCLAVDPSSRGVINLAVPLSEYAWKCRYPGEPCQPGPDEVAEALAAARGAFEAAVSRLPFDARP
jgi:HEPN domain-containing protein